MRFKILKITDKEKILIILKGPKIKVNGFQIDTAQLYLKQVGIEKKLN